MGEFHPTVAFMDPTPSQATAACSPFAIPHPKRFSAVNINKKFLQKNSSTAPAASLVTSLAATPAPQPSTVHSKLVTAKLTSTAQFAPTPGPGWSRPSSATPPVSATPSNVPPPPPSAPPPVPHPAKVIQPQPRTAVASSSAKPAWGNAKPLSVASDAAPHSDFPTAAEVAQGQSLPLPLPPPSSYPSTGRVPKPDDPKPDDSLVPTRVPPQEADAFRGVHLDPNAHHWDEMEEDDDNFLDNIIEFGDGRQYQVASQPPSASTATTPVDQEAPPLPTSPEPVSKVERFPDDYDRSWPRARQSPLVLQRDPSHLPSPSPAPSQPGLSPADGSRVLFNERSNRLEPYTTSHFPNRLGSNLGFSRRNAHGDPSVSPAEARFSKDVPPHSPSSRSHPGEFAGRRNPEVGDYSQNKVRTRDLGGPSGSFHDSRDVSEKRHRRLSGASFASSIHDSQQQGSPEIPFSRRSQPRESPLQLLTVLPANPSGQASRVSQLSGASNLEVQVSGTASALDLEGVHKTAMHISAERAKQRRQLEEEEREKEKERARKKAAEIEARIMEAQKAAAVEFIQQAVSVSDQPATKSEEQAIPTPGNSNERQPLLRPVTRTQRSNTTSGNDLPASEQVDSWRSKTRLRPQAPPSAFQELSDTVTDDNLEIVDFSDLGKFVGCEEASLVSPAPSSSYSPTSPDRHQPPTRPVASDFFDDISPHATTAKTISSPSSERHGPLTLPIVPETSVLPSNEQIQVPAHGIREYDSQRSAGPNGASTFTRSHPSPTASHHRLSTKGSAPFRQVTMSALDDVMSRIKGALDDMQVNAGRGASSNDPVDWHGGAAKPKVRVVEPQISARALPKEAKWLPPALRQPQQDLDQEGFRPTCCDPPCSPGRVSVVKLPTISRPVDALSKQQQQFLKNFSSFVRLDTLSWDPPVDGMSRRDLSVNEILFKPGKGHSKFRYTVHLPRIGRTRASLPKVNLPTGFSKVNSALGRTKAVDDLPTWRRGPISSVTAQQTPLPEEIPPTLNVTSCSPPPEAAELPSEPQANTRSDSLSVRHRTQPKLPAGSAVGFYRDPGSSCQDSKSTVNFTVGSELEEAVQGSQPESSMLLSSSIADAAPEMVPAEFKESVAIMSPIVDGEHYPSLSLITQADGKVSEESTERSLRTPASASFNTPWTKSPLSFSTKDSPARAPDPEHLRAVWSQTADKEQISAINSLEGIADDLTALPFTIQEVKSEDGETPPPTSAAVASKISLHDVTRAFQQVPTPSNPSSLRPPPLSPPSANGTIARPPTFNYPTPLQVSGPAVRPHFAAYSSPMLAHSPSPTVLYPPTAPSPVPRIPMNGHPQLYNPMWMPVQTSQNNGTVRPVPSPYPAQMVAYPTPTPVHPVYAPGLSPQNVPSSVAGSAPPRPHGVTMLSPVMHPAAPANVPMYNGSPVLMHPPAMIASGHRPPYMNSGPTERGQARSEGMSSAPHMQQSSHSQNHIPPQPMYSHAPFRW